MLANSFSFPFKKGKEEYASQTRVRREVIRFKVLEICKNYTSAHETRVELPFFACREGTSSLLVEGCLSDCRQSRQRCKNVKAQNTPFHNSNKLTHLRKLNQRSSTLGVRSFNHVFTMLTDGFWTYKKLGSDFFRP